MNNAISVGLSGLMALERRLETIAHNVANTNTVGFRAEAVRFSTKLEQAGQTNLAFAARGGEYLNMQQGARIMTGNALDVAISGEAFMAQARENGTVYTRDGRMEISPEGQLRSLDGYPVLDAGGAPIQVNVKGGPLTIANDGSVVQDKRRVGTLGLFELADPKLMQQHGSAAFEYSGFAEPVTDFRRNSILQGTLEGANVNAVAEMSEMITISRTFESIANALRANEEMMSGAIKTLGGG
jgi:flagellar basal-body rod protein FlgF